MLANDWEYPDLTHFFYLKKTKNMLNCRSNRIVLNKVNVCTLYRCTISDNWINSSITDFTRLSDIWMSKVFNLPISTLSLIYPTGVSTIEYRKNPSAFSLVRYSKVRHFSFIFFYAQSVAFCFENDETILDMHITIFLLVRNKDKTWFHKITKGEEN